MQVSTVITVNASHQVYTGITKYKIGYNRTYTQSKASTQKNRNYTHNRPQNTVNTVKASGTNTHHGDVDNTTYEAAYNSPNICYNCQVSTKIEVFNAQKYRILITETLSKHTTAPISVITVKSVQKKEVFNAQKYKILFTEILSEHYAKTKGSSLQVNENKSVQP